MDSPTERQPLAAKPKEERVLFDEGGVKVTTARIILPSQTYAVGGITSVGRFVEKPSRGVVVAFGLLALMFLLFGANFSSIKAAAIGVACGVVAVLIARSQKDKFHLLLRTAGGEVRALSSHNGANINRIVEAVEKAVVDRG